MRRVVFDNTFLTRIWQPYTSAPEDPGTKAPLVRHNERLEFLLETLEGEGSKVLVATPALTELLYGLKGRTGQELLEEIDGSSVFEVVGFNRRAAIEASILMQVHKSFSNRKAEPGTWQKIKVDWQIVAIAKVEKAGVIYSDDPDVKAFAETADIPCVSLVDLPLPPEEPQRELEFQGDKQADETPDSEPSQVPGSSDGPSKGSAATEGQAETEEEAPS